MLDNLTLTITPSQHSCNKRANSLVILGLYSNTFSSTLNELHDLATTYFKKTVHSNVEICSSLLGVWEVIAVLDKYLFCQVL